MSKVAGDSFYLGAIKDSLDSPNMILDLRIPAEPEVSAGGSRRGGVPLPLG